MIRLGIVLFIIAALSGLWELWALQSPGTPLYIGMLSGPIGSLRELATTFGAALLLSGLLLPRAGYPSEPKWLVVALYIGALLAVGAQLYAAVHGMYGVQANDLRPDALPLFMLKHLGLALLGLPLLAIGLRLLVRPGPPT